MQTMIKKWTKEEIKDLLQYNDKAVCRGIVAIWNLQTLEEQAYHTTKNDNGIGFNGVDADILSNFAEFYMQRGFLSPKQLGIARKKMMKYAGQLTKIANKEI